MTAINRLLYIFLMGAMALGWAVYSAFTHRWWALGMIPVILIYSSMKVHFRVIKLSERFGEHSALAATLMMLPIAVLSAFFIRADLDGLPGALSWAAITFFGCVGALLIQDWLTKKYRSGT